MSAANELLARWIIATHDVGLISDAEMVAMLADIVRDESGRGAES